MACLHLSARRDLGPSPDENLDYKDDTDRDGCIPTRPADLLPEKENGRHKLNPSQLGVFELVISALLRQVQLLLLVTRDPGTGKTHCWGHFVDYLQLHNVNSIALSFLWSAVYQILLSCPRMYIHRLLNTSHSTVKIEAILRGKT